MYNLSYNFMHLEKCHEGRQWAIQENPGAQHFIGISQRGVFLTVGAPPLALLAASEVQLPCAVGWFVEMTDLACIPGSRVRCLRALGQKKQSTEPGGYAIKLRKPEEMGSSPGSPTNAKYRHCRGTTARKHYSTTFDLTLTVSHDLPPKGQKGGSWIQL